MSACELHSRFSPTHPFHTDKLKSATPSNNIQQPQELCASLGKNSIQLGLTNFEVQEGLLVKA